MQSSIVLIERIVAAVVLLLLASLCPAGAQSSLLDNGVNGAGISANAYWDNGDIGSIGVAAGYSLAGIMDLGLGLGLEFSEIKGYGSRDVNDR